MKVVLEKRRGITKVGDERKRKKRKREERPRPVYRCRDRIRFRSGCRELRRLEIRITNSGSRSTQRSLTFLFFFLSPGGLPRRLVALFDPPPQSKFNKRLPSSPSVQMSF
jgi:hypothetical protein